MKKQVFFPIIAQGHYYLIIYNLHNGKSVVVDNSESDAPYDDKYKENVDFVVRNTYFIILYYLFN